MTEVFDATPKIRHPEERSEGARLEGRTAFLHP
jgi:hypothetical protein